MDFLRERQRQEMTRASRALLAAAATLERRALRYYTDAAEKIRALPEVARALKTLAKKRAKRIAHIERITE